MAEHVEEYVPATFTEFPDFSQHTNHLSKCMTREIFEKLKDTKTPRGFTLHQCIQAGVHYPRHPSTTVGAVAGDEETYEVFADLLDPIIKFRYGYDKDGKHVTDLNSENLKGDCNLDPNYVVSCRVRAARNIRGFSLPPHCSKEERREVENIIRKSLESFDGDFQGKYYPLSNMAVDVQEQLIKDHFLFDKPHSPLLVDSGMARDWPDGRGIWHNEHKNVLVWINEEDHSRVISMQKGGAMKEVFARFCEGVKLFEEAVRKQTGNGFMWNPHLGFVETCPSNIGSAMRASVHIKLPHLCKYEGFDEFLRFSMKMDKRGAGGEADVGFKDGMLDISNLARIGCSEVDQVQMVVEAIRLLIQMEQRLEKGQPIDDLIPPRAA